MSLKFWEKNLSIPQQHLALYSKNHYYTQNLNIKEAVRTIYAMNKGGVLTHKDGVLTNFAHKTLVKLVGPENGINTIGGVMERYENKKEMGIYPDTLLEFICAEISTARVCGSKRPDWFPEERDFPMLKVNAKKIEIDNGHVLYPVKRRRWECKECNNSGFIRTHKEKSEKQDLRSALEMHGKKRSGSPAKTKNCKVILNS